MRKLLCIGGACLILGTVLLVGRSWSAAKPAPPRPQSRIALLNLTYVIKKYDKFLTFQADLKEAVLPFQTTDAKLKEELEELRKEGAATADAERLEEIEQKGKEIQRQIEDNKAKANKALSKKQEEQLRILYKDVCQQAEKVAVSRGFEMVLHYNDAITQQDYWSAQNVVRKMQAGALMPMYHVPEVDISKEVVNLLNETHRKRKTSF
jgi:Skp family chaperone for outer membrane proteins